MANQSNVFNFDWDAEVPIEERDRMFDFVVKAVQRWKLEMPAVLFLETMAPLGNIAGQSAILLSPMLAMFAPGGIGDVQRLSKILADRENLRLLVDRIQEGETDAARK